MGPAFPEAQITHFSIHDLPLYPLTLAAVRDTGVVVETPEVAEQMKTTDRGAVIGKHALEGTDALCMKTIDVFVSAYGSEAGNLALKGLATGGVFITGGRSGMWLRFGRGAGFGAGVTLAIGGGVRLRLRRAISIMEFAAPLALGSTPPCFTSATSRCRTSRRWRGSSWAASPATSRPAAPAAASPIRRSRSARSPSSSAPRPRSPPAPPTLRRRAAPRWRSTCCSRSFPPARNRTPARCRWSPRPIDCSAFRLARRPKPKPWS